MSRIIGATTTVRVVLSRVFPCLTLCVALLWPHAAQADAVTAWNARAARAALAACLAPAGNGLAEARMYAMVHVAIHDALNAIDRRSRPYAYDAEVHSPTSPRAAVAAAARDVLVSVIGRAPGIAGLHRPPGSPAPRPTTRRRSQPSLQVPAKGRGVRVGRAAAAAIIALRASDGSDAAVRRFRVPARNGTWRVALHAGPPFRVWAVCGAQSPRSCSPHGSQFRPGPPDKVTSRRYAADSTEIKALGGDDITTPSARTADQTEIGLFWIESSPLAWNRIARSVSARKGLDLWENARLFGLLNLAHGRWLHRLMGRQVSLQLLAPGHGDPTADTDGNRDTGRGSVVDAAAADLSDAGLPLRSRDRGWHSGGRC